MATNIKRVVYFHNRIDATAARVRAKRSDIDLFRRDVASGIDETWGEIARAHLLVTGVVRAFHRLSIAASKS